MKTISKDSVDNLFRITRKYYKTGDVDSLPARLEMAEKLSKEAFDSPDSWLGFAEMASAIVGNDLKCQTIESDSIYKIFEILGFTVEEGVKK